MGVLLSFCGLGILALSVINMFRSKPQRAMMYAYILMASDFNLNQYIDYNTISKLVILLIVIICMLKAGSFRYVKKYQIVLYAFLLLTVVSYFENKSVGYTFSDYILSLLTILLGIGALHITWDIETKISLLKVMSISAIICIICGVIKNGSLITETGRIVSGTALYHSPAWMGIAGMFAGILLVEGFGELKYNKYVVMNFLLVCLTQMRGGIVFAAILFTPYIIKQLKNLTRFKVIVLALIIPLVIIQTKELFSILMTRTFIEGQLNTSGRFEAWPYFWNLAKDNLVLGHGIGSIKTMTESEIYRRGFTAAHNEYLRFIVETGITGLILVLVYIISAIRNILRRSILGDGKVYLVAFVLGFSVLSLLDNTVSGHISWVPFCLCLSLAGLHVDSNAYWEE